MKIVIRLLPILAVLLLSYFAIKPLFVSGFFPIHDNTQIARVFEMKKALQDGEFPVRWVADLGYGYGYPIFNFYAPLAYYVGGFFNITGFDSLIATKIMMGFGMILAGIFMYLLAKEFWGKSGGVVAGLLYVYAPYHALDLYVRGDIAELWAYAFIPLVFYGMWKAYSERQWRYVFIGSIGYAGIILSHNLTAMMASPFVLFAALLFYIYARQEEKMDRPYYPVIIVFIGLLLAGFYWLPVFAEMRYTNVLSQIGGGADYRDHFVCLSQLWNSPWGFGGSIPGCVDGLSFKIGKLHIILALLSLIALWLFWKTEKAKFGVVLFFTVAILFSLFLTLQSSQFIWDSFPQMAFFQYPWRFILIASFFISFLGGSTVWLAKRFIARPVFSYILIGILLLAIIYINSDVFVPQTYLHINASDYTNSKTLQWTTSRISDEYMPPQFVKPRNANEVPQGKIALQDGITVQSLNAQTQKIQAVIAAKEKSEILIYQAYFPGWHVFIDGTQSYFAYFGRGILVTIPQGAHTVVLAFQQTPIEIAANILSLTGVFVLILGIITTRRKQPKHAKKST